MRQSSDDHGMGTVAWQLHVGLSLSRNLSSGVRAEDLGSTVWVSWVYLSNLGSIVIWVVGVRTLPQVALGML